jgi:hypothetical protein
VDIISDMEGMIVVGELESRPEDEKGGVESTVRSRCHSGIRSYRIRKRLLDSVSNCRNRQIISCLR